MLEFHDVRDGALLASGALTVSAAPVQHLRLLGFDDADWAFRVDAPGGSVAISGDTVPCDAMVELARDVDVLIHEATFLADERERARETSHSTAGEAALVAREAGVRLLALVHLSTRYFGHQVVDEARELFPETVVPRDFDTVEIPFAERGAPALVRAGARARKAAVGSEGT